MLITAENAAASIRQHITLQKRSSLIFQLQNIKRLFEVNTTDLAFGKKKPTTDNTTNVPISHRKLAIPIGSLLTKGGA